MREGGRGQKKRQKERKGRRYRKGGREEGKRGHRLKKAKSNRE